MARRKNRKAKKNEVRVPFPVLLANVLVMVAVLGLSYMWLCARGDALGKQIKRKEAELASTRKLFEAGQMEWANTVSPVNIERAIKRFGLNMGMPPDSRIVRVNYRSEVTGLAYNR